MTCQCFRSSAISVIIILWFLAISSSTRSRHLSFGLPRFRYPSTVICNIFLVAPSLPRLCTCPNHINLFSLRNFAIGYMCAPFQIHVFISLTRLYSRLSSCPHDIKKYQLTEYVVQCQKYWMTKITQGEMFKEGGQSG